MNNDCIFTTLLFCTIKTISKIISINKLIKQTSTEYLWRLLCMRDHKFQDYEKFTISWYDKYRLCHLITPLQEYINTDSYGHRWKVQTVHDTYYDTRAYFELQPSYKNIYALKNLTELSIYYNLEQVPKEILNLTQLKILVFIHNNIKKIPSTIDKLHNLEEFTCRGHSLKSVPSELFNLTKLTKLDLSDNELNIIPSKINNLVNLTYLNISINKLTEIPKEISNLHKLTNLILYYNKLKRLPECICQLTNLEVLDISYNPIKLTPRTYNLISLKKFILPKSLQFDFIIDKKVEIIYV